VLSLYIPFNLGWANQVMTLFLILSGTSLVRKKVTDRLKMFKYGRANIKNGNFVVVQRKKMEKFG
jgi:predicted peroxiredoxin